MKINRREFMGTATATAGLATIGGRPVAQNDSDDPLGVRRDFPITREGIYLNSAYIAPPPVQVAQAGVSFTEAKTFRPISLSDMLARTDQVRGKFARLVGVDEDEIGFLYSTSEGENLVVSSLDLQPGDNIVIDELQYPTTFVLYKHLEKTVGLELRIARQRDGAVPLEAFASLVDDHTRMVSVTWVSHQNGYRHDMQALAGLAHERKAYLYTDAVQAVGMFPMNLHQEGIDFLASGTYKWLLASYGIAPFFVRRELLEKFPPDRRGALHVEKELGNYQYQLFQTAKKYEYATLAFGPLFQLGAALEYLEQVGVDKIEAHTVGLASKLHQGLTDRGFKVLTPSDNRSSIVTFVHQQDIDTARRLMKKEGIEVSHREQGPQIRVGIALFNNESEIERFLEVTEKLA